MPLYPADIFPHPSAVQEQGGPLIQYWRFSIGGVVISRAAPEMQADWQLSFKSGSPCLCHPPCCGDPANRHFMHYPAFFSQEIKRNRPCVLWTHGLFCFTAHLFHGVFSGVFPESAVIFLIVQLAAAQRLMDVQIVLGHIDDAAGDIGAVVGGALQIRQQVCPHKARLDAALALPHPQDVTGTQLLLQ